MSRTRLGGLLSQVALAHGQQDEITQTLSEFVLGVLKQGITSSLTKERLLAQCIENDRLKSKKESCWGQGWEET